MKKLVLLLLIISGCTEEQKKDIESNFILNLMTNGEWKVKSFTQGATDKTAEFADYKFRFQKTNKLDAISVSSGTTFSTADWTADGVARTIYANFPSNANSTLLQINGTWKITDSDIAGTYVVGNMTASNGEIKNVRLEKL